MDPEPIKADGGEGESPEKLAPGDRSTEEFLKSSPPSPPAELGADTVETVAKVVRSFPLKTIYQIPQQNQTRCHIFDEAMYKRMYWRSLHDAEAFWTEKAKEFLRWVRPFTKVSQGKMENGSCAWFLNGKLNVCENCVDRWAEQYPDAVALVCEADEPHHTVRITYEELLKRVCQFANLLKLVGVRKGDVVTIYLPMIAEIAVSMLACARIGAVHNVVFGGFAARSLAERIQDCNSKVLVTADESSRGGKMVHFKKLADEALRLCPEVKHVLVVRCSNKPVDWTDGRDLWADELVVQMPPYCPLEIVDSEDPLFILYTSGSTGRPKGLCHTSGGYLLYSALTHKYVFDYHVGDVFGCVADCGWITGHSYVIYGPLCNGATTVLFQSIPTYPDPGRYWAMVEELRITQFYTSPTAIRHLIRYGDSWPEKYDLSSLRVLGSVGEPINPEVWRWYFTVVGKGRCSVVDTYWQTESGGHLITPLPGAIRTKPGCATLPFFGIELCILDPVTGEEKLGPNACGVLCVKRPWPGLARTINKAHLHMISTYFSPYKGYFFTGDGAFRDEDGYYWVTGRVDDTLNVSGHRLTTAEIEHAMLQHPGVAEAVVVGVPHAVKGTCILCFAIVKEGTDKGPATVDELRQIIRRQVGPIATPDHILLVNDVPKTKSGKIMRRLLRKIATFEVDNMGDLSTLVNPSSIPPLVDTLQNLVKPGLQADAAALSSAINTRDT
nr:acetyl-CoA synthetase [Sarcocystis cruzi]